MQLEIITYLKSNRNNIAVNSTNAGTLHILL